MNQHQHNIAYRNGNGFQEQEGNKRKDGGAEPVENPKDLSPSATTPFTVHHAMAYLTRSLMTKTGESPATCGKLARKLFGVLKPFSVDYPTALPEAIRRIDLLERKHPTAWYLAQARKEILVLRHELEQAQPPLPELADLVATIGR